MSGIIKSKEMKARKDHKCDWCSSTIHKGQIYKRDTIVYDDKIYDWLSCGKCQKYIDEMLDEWKEFLYLDEITEEDLYNFCKEKYDKTPKELVEEGE